MNPLSSTKQSARAVVPPVPDSDVISRGRAKCSGNANIAARSRRGRAGGLVATAAVQRQVAGLFVAEDKGAHELKGVAAPMTLYRIVRTSGGRPGPQAAGTLTPLVGRNAGHEEKRHHDRGTVKANKYRPFSASNLAERVGDSLAKTVGPPPAPERQLAV